MNNGWMIEYHFDDTNGPHFWTGDYINHTGKIEWTTNPNHGVRFSRKCDAEMVMVGVLGLKLPCLNVLAVEHEWV